MSAADPNTWDRHPVVQKLLAAWPPMRWRGETLLMAVSGGADSVALLRCLRSVSAANDALLHVAHFNHATRGAESDADAEFVARLTGQLDLPCHVEVWQRDSRESGSRVSEEACRKARYAFLRHQAEELGIRLLVTAHTADDQVETVLHRMLRGTSLTGLSGMPFARPLGPAVSLIRPFLSTRRAEILDFLAAIGQDYRHDSSNADNRFTRNRLRAELIPLMRTIQPGADDHILRMVESAAEWQQALKPLVEDLLERAIVPSSLESVELRTDVLGDAAPILVGEGLTLLWRRQGWPRKEMGRREWKRLIHLIQGEPATASITLPGAVQARRSGGRVFLARRAEAL